MVILIVLFALFIFFCGTGHLLRSLELTKGRAFDVLNRLTAFISVATALYLVPIVPHLFQTLDAALAAEMESKRKVMAFMSFLCHEIRNPLFAITSTITFMGDDASLSKEQQDSLECIEQSANLMLRLVNDVLDLSKLESGKIQLEKRRFDLIKMVEGTAASFQNSVAQRSKGEVSFKLNVESSVPRYVIGDSVRLLQMIYNLLTNSCKFTEKGFIMVTVDTVPLNKAIANKWINCKCGETKHAASDKCSIATFLEDKHMDSGGADVTSKLLLVEEGFGGGIDSKPCNTIVLKLAVADSGSGINPQRQQNIFEPYSQAKLSDYRKHGGTGLGLSIVTRLTETFGGTIHLKSIEGEGSEFTIFIPIMVAMAGPEMNSRLSDNDFTKNNIFLRLEKDLTSNDADSATVEDADTSTNCVFETHAHSLQVFGIGSQPENEKNTAANIGVRVGEVKRKDESASEDELVVLIVDDNMMNRKLLGRMLENVKLKHFDAENGRQAVDFMVKSRNNSHNPNAPTVGLILMDWYMPIMDGCEATRIIRDMKLDVPIVALTACALEEGLGDLKNAGCNEIATKPIIREDLMRICHRYIDNISSRQDDNDNFNAIVH